MSPRRAVSQALAGCLALGLAACATAPVAEEGRVQIKIEGDEAVSERTLRHGARREMAAYVKSGHRPADAADAAYALRRTLHEAGHPRAEVTFEITPSEDAPQTLTFRVTEGPLAVLGDITFPGAETLPAERLIAFFKFPRTGLLRAGPRLYRRSAVESAVADVRGEHRLEGFLDAQVGPAATRWDADGKTAHIAVPIVEGRRYTVADVTVSGELPEVVRDAVKGQTALVGRPYYRRLPIEAAGAVRRALLAHGYQRAKSQGHVEIDAKTATVRIAIDVEAGPVVIARKVLVEGRDRSRAALVRGRIDVTPGAPIAQKAIDDAYDDLYATGVFKSVRIELRPPPGAPNDPAVADVVVTVNELPGRSVELQAGWGSYEKARGSATYTDRNLSGTGRVLDVRAGVSVMSARVHGQLTDPHLLGPDYSAQLGTGYQRRQEPSFDRRTAEIDATIDRKLGARDHLLFGYSFRAEEAQDVDGGLPGIEDDGFVRSAGLFARLRHDVRDSQLFPTRGYDAEVGVFWSTPGLGADLDFLETKASAARYFPLGDHTVLAISGELLVRTVLDERLTLPIQERVFCGGENSVRSFRESELGPFNADDEPVGGLTAAEAHIELRQRLLGDLDGAVFYDLGTVGIESWSFDEDSGSAIGAGLRYRLPVGPVRLDFGYNPGERFSSDDSWALHLSFGFSF